MEEEEEELYFKDWFKSISPLLSNLTPSKIKVPTTHGQFYTPSVISQVTSMHNPEQTVQVEQGVNLHTRRVFDIRNTASLGHPKFWAPISHIESDSLELDWSFVINCPLIDVPMKYTRLLLSHCV
jgi:hypothetical protein